MVVKAIIFDCFGVLVTSARNKLSHDYPKLRTQIDDIGHQSDYGMTSRQQFDDSLAELVGITSNEVESRYWGASIRNESVVNWVRDIKESGNYKVGMLSNVGRGFFEDFLPVAEQSNLFDEVVLSYEIGMIKPEIAIYEYIANRLGVMTNECIMIDDMPLNIEGAKNAGMQGIQFISINQAMSELENLLGSNRA
ncbi:MAG: HAD family phosphatase [Candidatus Saccharibacteria bacterium]